MPARIWPTRTRYVTGSNERAVAERPFVFFGPLARFVETSFVIERGDGLVPVEVKSGRTATHDDTKALRLLLDEYADRAHGALLLYAGDEVFWIADRILAVPWWRMV